jgi:hypothetical protein
MKKKGRLTNAMLDEIYKKLCEDGGASRYDENGKPVYSMTFYGTEKEAEALRKRLLELDPDTKQPNF